MVSLWGSRNAQDGKSGQADGADNDDGETGPSHVYHDGDREATEHTRLLPPRAEGYLDPDDPAVSPYNLWSVRALRYFSSLFLGITFLWWVLLLVAIFVSPPGMHSRGSGFFDFSFTTLTAGNLVLAILFFATPSLAMQISSLVIAVFLLVDMILIVASPRLRAEEGWVGIASVVWALIMALFNVMTDRVVAWGKKEEEERLTGRQESRRTLREWCAVLTSTIIMVVLILVTLLLTATLILRIRDSTLEVPGERYFVDDNKYQVHLDCVGLPSHDSADHARPTILLEAGEMPSEHTLQPFIHAAYTNGSISRYCYWDRPGVAFSDNAPSPHSAGMSAESLSEALAQANEHGPWLLVSAGIGSITSRIFAARHARDITGLLIIDGLHEDLLYGLAAPGRGFLLWARGVLSPLGLDRLPAALFRGRTREDRVYGRAAYQGGKFIKAQLQEALVAGSLTHSEVAQARNILAPSTPLVVVSSGRKCREDQEWEEKQRDLTMLTEHLMAWDVVEGAPHEVWRTNDGRQVLEKRLAELVAL